jgi:ankyrin repeat protein
MSAIPDFNIAGKTPDELGLMLIEHEISNCLAFDLFQKIVTAGARLDLTDREMGWTPLVWSIYNNNLPEALLLIEHGGHLHKSGKAEVTPLMTASMRNLHVVMDALLDQKVSVHARDGLGNTALHRATTIETISKLQSAGADIDATNDSGRTPFLHLFLAQNYSAARNHLLCGASPDLRDNKGKNVHDYAASTGTEGTLEPMLTEAREYFARKEAEKAAFEQHMKDGMPTLTKTPRLGRIQLKKPSRSPSGSQ